MNKLFMEGLTFRVDRYCPVTRKSMDRLINQRYRRALYAFRKLFSQYKILEGQVCASQVTNWSKKDIVVAQEMAYLN